MNVNEPIGRAVLGVVSATFGIPLDDLELTMRPGNLQEWDSLGHIMLIEALEEEFGVQLSEEEVFDVESISDLVAAFGRRLGPETQA